MGASRTDSSAANLHLPGSWTIANLARASPGCSARSVHPALDHRHEGCGRNGKPAARGLPGSNRNAACVSPLWLHGRPYPPPVALRLRAARPLGPVHKQGGTFHPSAGFEPSSRCGALAAHEASAGCQDRFLAAVQAEEAGEKNRAIEIYEEILKVDPGVCGSLHQPGDHQLPSALLWPRRGALPPRHRGIDPTYVLAFFDLGNVLDELQRCSDESIAAYRPGRCAFAAVRRRPLSNLALAYERQGRTSQGPAPLCRLYMEAGQRSGPWADHARGQIRKLLSQEKFPPLPASHRAFSYPAKGGRRLRTDLARHTTDRRQN